MGHTPYRASVHHGHRSCGSYYVNINFKLSDQQIILVIKTTIISKLYYITGTLDRKLCYFQHNTTLSNCYELILSRSVLRITDAHVTHQITADSFDLRLVTHCQLVENHLVL